MVQKNQSDPDLDEVLSKSDQKSLARIVEYLESSPVIFIEREKKYKENTNSLPKIYGLISRKIRTSGGHGFAGLVVSMPTYRDIVLAICSSAGLDVSSLMTVRDAERLFLEWAFEKSRNATKTNEHWNGDNYPPEKLISITRDKIILGFKDPKFQAVVTQSFRDANDFVKQYSKIILENISLVSSVINADTVKKNLPAWMLSALGSTAALVQGISTTATAAVVDGAAVVGGAATGLAAVGGAAAAAYAGLISVYVSLALAGPASGALFPCVYEIALLRLKQDEAEAL